LDCNRERQYLCSTFAKRGGHGAAVREKFIEGIEEASVVQEKKRERSQFGQVTLRRYNKEKEKIQRRV